MATSFANAEAGTKINITAAGSGTNTIISGAHLVGVAFNLADNDEIWLDGRKGKTTIFWNTDFPIPEDADWTAIRPGIDSSNEITATGKSSNRLFLFTANSGQKFDGANPAVFNNHVGCLSYHSLKNIDDDWQVWIDNKGRIWARNETSGQQEHISRGIHQLLLRLISKANIVASSAVVNENLYYLYLGSNNVGKGTEKLRVVYSFDDNNWSIDRMPRHALFASNDDYTGELKPYYFSTDGYLYIDDYGQEDDGLEIPLEIEMGEDHFGSEKIKKFTGIFIHSKDAAGMVVKVSVDGKQPKAVGQITSDKDYIQFPEANGKGLDRGVTANVFITGAAKGDQPVIQGHIVYYSTEERIPNERR